MVENALMEVKTTFENESLQVNQLLQPLKFPSDPVKRSQTFKLVNLPKGFQRVSIISSDISSQLLSDIDIYGMELMQETKEESYDIYGIEAINSEDDDSSY